MRAGSVCLVIAGLGAATVTNAAAQNASMVVVAEVSDIAITILAGDQLRFGGVVPGTPAAVDPKVSANAGRFEIRGARRAEFTLDMVLPAQLTTGAGPWSMPIAFGPSGACHRDKNQQSQCAYYDPSTTLVARLRAAPYPTNTYFVWVGGTVSPAPAQVPGVYSATISATVAYTGN